MAEESLLLQLLHEVRDEQKRMADQLDNIELRASALESTIKQHENECETVRAFVLTAFPSGDLNGHARYHQGVIDWMEKRNRLIGECLINAAKAGFLVSTGWIIYAIYNAIKMEFMK